MREFFLAQLLLLSIFFTIKTINEIVNKKHIKDWYIFLTSIFWATFYLFSIT